MPKLVYSCIFCHSSFDTFENAKEHEGQCLADPAFHGCWSCEHMGWACDDYACGINADNNGTWCPEVTNCPKWEKVNDK